MGFDSEKFMATNFIPREDVVKVDDLKDFFDDKKKPEWKIRGLKGVEIARARESAEKNKKLKSIIEGIVSENNKKLTEAIKDLIGNPADVPQDIAYRVETLIAGSIEPSADYPLAVKLCEVYPIEFYDITNRIIQLSGKGHIPGKAQPSGKTMKPAQR